MKHQPREREVVGGRSELLSSPSSLRILGLASLPSSLSKPDPGTGKEWCSRVMKNKKVIGQKRNIQINTTHKHILRRNSNLFLRILPKNFVSKTWFYQSTEQAWHILNPPLPPGGGVEDDAVRQLHLSRGSINLPKKLCFQCVVLSIYRERRTASVTTITHGG